MRTSHGRFRPDAVDARPRHDGLFQGEGTGEEAHQERDSLLQALYTASLHARGDVDAIDRMLDAHREAFGEPEQVAYARQQDKRHDRALPLPSGGLQLRPSTERYLDEHRPWNPPTAKEAAIARARGLAMVLEGRHGALKTTLPRLRWRLPRTPRGSGCAEFESQLERQLGTIIVARNTLFPSAILLRVSITGIANNRGRYGKRDSKDAG
ncbi:hypothetical protein AR275_28490 [Stenotrophomonas maltophilia]|nr:hypothetical protein AR275_28490 [Stenotrophomonas maltophilia]